MNGQEPELPPLESPADAAPLPPSSPSPSGQEFLYPAFMAAICSGALSGVPVLNIGCLLWMVGGGTLAVYFFAQKHGRHLTRLADGARLGMMTGFFGFFFGFFINLLSQLLIFRGFTGLVESYRKQIEKYPMPPGPESAQLQAWAVSPAGTAVFFILGAAFFFMAFVIFSTAGGVLGVRTLRKE